MSNPFRRSQPPRIAGKPEPFTDQATGFSGWRVGLDPDRPVPTPAVFDGRVFVGGGFGSYEFYAFDARSGAAAWHLKTGDDGPTAAVVADGFVVFNTESCTLEVVEVKTGQVLWERVLGDPLLAQPAVMDGRIFMAYPKDGEHRLGCFALQDGHRLWATRLDHDVITAPVVAAGKVYLSTFDGVVWCVDAATGKVEWSQQLRATSAPWIYEGDVFVAHRDDGRPGERKPGDPARTTATETEAEWRMPRERTSRHDAFTGLYKSSSGAKRAAYLSSSSGLARRELYHKMDSSVGFGAAPSSAKLHLAEELLGENLVSRAWRFQGSRPVVVNGILYDTTGDRLEASDTRSGGVLWSWQNAKETQGERRLTPPAVANGRVWAGTWDGRIISWDSSSGGIRWAVNVGAPCHWQPVLKDGWVFAGLENGTLVGFATGDPLDSDWPMWGGGCGHNGTPVPESGLKSSVIAEPITASP